MPNVDFGIHLHADGADQAAAGVAKVDQAAAKLERTMTEVQKTQADLAAATLKAQTAQAAHAKLLAEAAPSQEKITAAAVRMAQAQAAQARAALAAKDAQALLARQTQQFGGAAALTAQQAQQLSFQLNDLFVQIAAGQNPLTALIQQGSQLSGTFGGIGNTFRALATVFTPARVALGGIAAAAGLFAAAALRGSDESKELARALEITGNAAGLTEARFNEMSRSIADSTRSGIGQAREVVLQLAASGRLGADAIEATAEAALRLAKATGQSAEEVSKTFLQMTGNVTAGAIDLNRTYNFLNTSQLQHIQHLQEQGRSQEAVAFTMRELSARVGDQTQNLGLLERAWQGLGRAVSEVWNTLKSVGRTSTTTEQIAAIERQIAAIEAGPSSPEELSRGRTAAEQATLDALHQQLDALREIQRLQGRTADDAEREARARQQAGRGLALLNAARSSRETLEVQLGEARELLRIGTLTEAQFARISQHIRQTAAATGQALDTMTARLQAQGAKAAAVMQGNLREIQHLIATGQASQIEGIERIAALEVQALEDERTRLQEQLRIAQQRRENTAEVARLQGQIDAKSIEIANRVRDGQLQVAEAIHARRRAGQALTQAQVEENKAAQTADVRRQDAERRQLRDAITGQATALGESVEMFRLEQSLAGADQRTRAVRIEQLRVEQQLRRQIAALEQSGLFDPDELETLKRRLRDAATTAGQLIGDRVAFEFRQRGAERIERDLIDAFAQGADAAERYLKNFFRRQVFEIILQPIVRPFAAVLSAAAQNLTGGGAAGAAQQAFGVANLYSAGQSLWQGFSSGFSGAGAAASGAVNQFAVSRAGQQLGLSVLTEDAAGNIYLAQTSGASQAAGFAGSAASTAAGVAAGIYGGRAISGGYSTGGSGNANVNAGTAIGAVIGSIVPGIGTAIGAAVGGIVGGLVNRLFGRRAPEVESQFLEGSFSAGGDFGGQTTTNIVERGGLFRSDRRSQQIEAVTGDLDKALDEGGRQLAALAEQYGRALGLPIEQLTGVTQRISVEITEDAQANQQAIEAAVAQYAEALLGAFADEIEPLRQAGETVAQTIERVGGNLLEVNELLRLLGLTALETSIAGGDAALRLVELAGGLGNLGQAAGVYYQEFYSEAERAARGAELIAQSLGQVNIALPASREEFRRQVEAQDLSTESGRKAFTALLSVAGAFAQIVPAAEEAQTAAEQMTATLRERAGLEERLLRLQGDTMELRRRERETLDETNRAIYDQIAALEDQQAALAGSARLLSAIDSNIGEFLSPDQMRQFQVQRIRDNLAGVGVNFSIDQLLGASRQQIVDFARTFLALEGVSYDAKVAVIEAAGALGRLVNAAEDAARQTAIDDLQRQLDGIVDTIGDFSVLGEVERVSDAYQRHAGELAELERNFAQLMGTVQRSVQDTLAEMLTQQRRLQDYREGLADAIEDARLRSLGPDARVAALRASEATLFAQLGSAADPVAVAQRLQGVILQRIREEASLRERALLTERQLAQQARDLQIESLEGQIRGFERLRELGAEIAQFRGELAFSDLSPLSFEDQLRAAQRLFDDTVAGARAGDQAAISNLLGNARGLLQEAQSFAPSSELYAGIFAAVTGTLAEFEGLQVDPQIAALQEQLEALRAIGESQDAEQLIAAAELQELSRLYGAVVSRQESDATAIANQIELAREQIAQQTTIVEELRAQIVQAAAAHREIKERLDRLIEGQTEEIRLATLEGAEG